MPPGIPGRTEFNPLPDHEPGTTNADKARQMLEDSGNLDYPIQFLYSQDDPVSVDTKDAIVKGLKAAGFDPQPYATTVADTDELTVVIRSRRAALRHRLTTVRGRAQMTVRLLESESGDAAFPART